MDIIGLDLHKRESQLSIKADDGTITDRRIVTSRERFAAVFGGRPRARILLEASTESEWVARHLDWVVNVEARNVSRWGGWFADDEALIGTVEAISKESITIGLGDAGSGARAVVPLFAIKRAYVSTGRSAVGGLESGAREGFYLGVVLVPIIALTRPRETSGTSIRAASIAIPMTVIGGALIGMIRRDDRWKQIYFDCPGGPAC